MRPLCKSRSSSMMACHIQKTSTDKVPFSRLMRHQRRNWYVAAMRHNVNRSTGTGKEVRWLRYLTCNSTSLFDEVCLDYSFLTTSDGPNELLWLDTSSPLQTHEWWLQNYSQETLPSVPSEENRRVDLNILNPFAEDSANRHPYIRRTQIPLPQDSTINGYIKVRFWNPDNRPASVLPPNRGAFCRNALAVRHRSLPHVPSDKANIPWLLPDFGRALKLDELDSKLFKFCEHFANVSVAVSPSLLT
jgi:hypothetical protein